MKNRLKILGNRTIGVITILTLLTYIFINIINTNAVYSKHISEDKQPREEYNSSKIDKYPGYKQLIEKVKAAHPNWNIKIHYTNLDWNTVIKNETTERHARNLVSKNNTSNWFCSVCKDKPYDNGTWRCASEEAVSYYMDPRNFMDDNSIIQFEQSIFNSAIHSVDGIMNMTTGSFLAGRENADAILEACKRVNINPYQVVARILQEQGKGGSTMSRGNEGYYNVFNVEASGNSSEEIIRNATKYAREHGWNTLAKSILGGIDFLKSKYIGIGQDTLYLQKFDVDDNGSLYYHQYMQNLSAALTESYKVRDIYQKMGTFNSSITLCIPVYENMPSAPCQKPGIQNIVTQDAQIKAGHTGINVRETPSTSAKSLREINSGEKFLRIEIGTQNINKYYWDKVVLSDGTIGYIATDFVEQINDIMACNETVKLTGSAVRLRNGPGTSGTTVKDYLDKEQTVTRVEKNKYHLDGLYWDRVITSSGLQGYVASNYLELISCNDNFVVEGTDLICEPFTTVEKIKEYHHSAATIKNLKDEIITTGQIGTGFKVIINKSTYIAVKYGDVNGDGKLNTGDSLMLSKQVLGSIKLTDRYILKAADINKDGKINSGDTLILRKQILGTQNISI